MNEITTQRSQELIASEINSIKHQTRQMVLYNSIEIGKRLVEAKEVVAHGEWGKWLENSVDYSQSTANNLMKIYEEYGDGQATLFGGDANSEAIASLPYTKALALLSIPNYEREEFIEENNVQDMSTRELDKAIKEKKELEKKLQIFEEEAEKHKDLKLQLSTSQSVVKTLESKLEKAEENDNSEEIQKLHEEIRAADAEKEEYENKIKKLEKELKEKPIEVPETIEKVPKEVEEELEKLRKQVENKSNDEAEVKFKFQFESLVENFSTLLGSLNEIQDEETRNKFKGAVNGLIDKMKNNL